MCLSQAPLDTCLGSPFFASLSVHPHGLRSVDENATRQKVASNRDFGKHDCKAAFLIEQGKNIQAPLLSQTLYETRDTPEKRDRIEKSKAWSASPERDRNEIQSCIL